MQTDYLKLFTKKGNIIPVSKDEIFYLHPYIPMLYYDGMWNVDWLNDTFISLFI